MASSTIGSAAAADVVSVVLAQLPPSEHDRLVSLVAEAPRVVARIIPGIAVPHKATLCRAVSRGVRGVRLRTVTRGRTRYTCARWLAEFWLAVDERKRMPARGGAGAKGAA